MLFKFESQCFQNLEQALTGVSFNIQLGGLKSWSIRHIGEDFS